MFIVVPKKKKFKLNNNLKKEKQNKYEIVKTIIVKETKTNIRR
ncbi:hypothetical protein DOY81_008058 [Sarcophaga bullata]|nr:hypothetical protein DOY81_008058 [Sarcophaga bullata]